MEAFLNWLIQSLTWDALKGVFARTGTKDARLVLEALADVRNQRRELDEQRKLMETMVEQRNSAKAELIEAKRRILELEAECVELRAKSSKPRRRKG